MNHLKVVKPAFKSGRKVTKGRYKEVIFYEYTPVQGWTGQFDKDCLEVIFWSVFSEQLEEPNLYTRRNVKEDIEQTYYEVYKPNSAQLNVSCVCRQAKDVLRRYLEKQKVLILLREDTFKYLCTSSMRLVNPMSYCCTWNEYKKDGGDAAEMFPMHYWLPYWSTRTKVVNIGRKTIGKVTILRETDVDNKNVHYITTTLEADTCIQTEVSSFRVTVPEICWEKSHDENEKEDIREFQTDLVNQIKAFVREEMHWRFGVALK